MAPRRRPSIGFLSLFEAYACIEAPSGCKRGTKRGTRLFGCTDSEGGLEVQRADQPHLGRLCRGAPERKLPFDLRVDAFRLASRTTPCSSPRTAWLTLKTATRPLGIWPRCNIHDASLCHALRSQIASCTTRAAGTWLQLVFRNSGAGSLLL